jgi:hypothetical protein
MERYDMMQVAAINVLPNPGPSARNRQDIGISALPKKQATGAGKVNSLATLQNFTHFGRASSARRAAALLARNLNMVMWTTGRKCIYSIVCAIPAHHCHHTGISQ